MPRRSSIDTKTLEQLLVAASQLVEQFQPKAIPEEELPRGETDMAVVARLLPVVMQMVEPHQSGAIPRVKPPRKAANSRVEFQETGARGPSYRSTNSRTTCYGCGKQGHLRANCPQYQSQDQGNGQGPQQ